MLNFKFNKTEVITMKSTNKFLIATLLSTASLCLPLGASAQYGQSNNTHCTGFDSYRTCTDYNNGNTYDIRKFGNQTYVDGYNSNTGSTWNQNSTRIGDTTWHQGNSANGNSWDITEQNIGGTRYIYGNDSRGNYVNCMMTAYINTCDQ